VLDSLWGGTKGEKKGQGEERRGSRKKKKRKEGREGGVERERENIKIPVAVMRKK
jgi:hypothetical protein